MTYTLTTEELFHFEETADVCEMDIRQAYSGRGMTGQNCIGVVGTLENYTDFLIEFMQCAYSAGCSDQLLRTLKSVRQDSMGMDDIFYWPKIQAPQ